MSNTLKKVGIFGHFGFGETLLNGQTIKTKIVTEELERRFGTSEVVKYDTHGGMRALLKLPTKAFFALKQCKNILIFPAQNGLRILTPLLLFYKAFFRKRKLHYVVIGGWLPEFLRNRKHLSK